MAGCKNDICQTYGCDTPVTAPGLLGEEIILVNYIDVDKSASTFNVVGELTQVVLNAGTEMYRWQGGSDSVSITNTGTAGNFIAGKWQHGVSFSGIGNTWAKKSGGYDAFVKGRYIAFVRDKDKNIHVFGWSAGMRGANSWNAMDNDGTWKIDLATMEPEFETTSAKNYVGNGTPAPSLDAAWEQLVALAPCV